MSRHSTRVLHCVAALGLGLVLTACGDETGTATPATSSPTTATSEPTTDSSSQESDEPSETAEPEPTGTVVDITFADGSVTPAGDRVEVGVGEEVVLRIDADAPGELHAHTTEELTLAYPAGRSEQVIVVDQPGVVDVESHDLGVVIVQLQVS